MLAVVMQSSAHWMRWYVEWLYARLRRPASRAIVGLSHSITLFIYL